MAAALAAPAAGASLSAGDAPLFPADEICSPVATSEVRSLDPLRLVRWLIAISEIGDAALDADGDGDTLLGEKQLALTQPGYCTRDIGRACTTEDAATLDRIQARLADFVDRAGGPDYVFERRRRPTIEERVQADFLNPFFEVTGRRFQVAEVLDVKKRFVEIYCTAPEPIAPVSVADVAAPEIIEEPERPHWIFNPRDADGLRLTSEIDDLTKDRSKLGAVRPAELSITADLEDDETLYQVKAVVGYNVEVERSDLIFTSTIPFLLFERFFNGEENEIDKLGFGVQEAFNILQPDRSGSEMAITPLYLTDSDFDSDIGILKLRWTPTLAPDAPLPIGFPRTYGPLTLQVEIDALADFGRVFDDGGDDDLGADAEFFRVGGRIGLQFRGAENTGFDHIALDVSNRYLKDIDGNNSDLYRLDLSLSYLFSQSENYRLSVSYANGRTDDTLEQTEYWKTQFGIRF
ncbi:MAG: hypothetical protein OEU92_02475 [Alphaproteobacteria bacterium]|nr:hypothetical protein [Alphaproteobacteria bacterium]